MMRPYDQLAQPNDREHARRSRFRCPPMRRAARDRATLSTTPIDLIAALERLIAKKQAIKQGMMQQLLTGRTRLPGFNERLALTSRSAIGDAGRTVASTDGRANSRRRTVSYDGTVHSRMTASRQSDAVRSTSARYDRALEHQVPLATSCFARHGTIRRYRTSSTICRPAMLDSGVLVPSDRRRPTIHG